LLSKFDILSSIFLFSLEKITASSLTRNAMNKIDASGLSFHTEIALSNKLGPDAVGLSIIRAG